jgi:hypothetical protein
MPLKYPTATIISFIFLLSFELYFMLGTSNILMQVISIGVCEKLKFRLKIKHPS